MIQIASDFHLGVVRNSHTTPASRERLRDALYLQALRATEGTFSVCLGDLFDTFWNDAVTLRQGKRIWDRCQLVLTGNHDRSNRSNSVSSLEFLEGLDDLELPAVTDKPKVRRYDNFLSLNKPVQWVDHKMTQALFDESLDLVEAVGGMLFLHCNYDSGFATDESSLNLTKEQAEILLTKVGKIFIGHEHIPAEHFGGRLVIVGNTHPTSFSDISDKYVYHVDSDLNVTKELIWDSKKNSLKFDYKSLAEEVYLDGYQFIELTGQAETSELPKISRAVANLWKTCPNVLMIKNSVTSTKVEVVPTETVKITDMLATISSELRGTKLHAVWQNYLEKIS